MMGPFGFQDAVMSMTSLPTGSEVKPMGLTSSTTCLFGLCLADSVASLAGKVALTSVSATTQATAQAPAGVKFCRSVVAKLSISGGINGISSAMPEAALLRLAADSTETSGLQSLSMEDHTRRRLASVFRCAIGVGSATSERIFRSKALSTITSLAVEFDGMANPYTGVDRHSAMAAWATTLAMLILVAVTLTQRNVRGVVATSMALRHKEAPPAVINSCRFLVSGRTVRKRDLDRILKMGSTMFSGYKLRVLRLNDNMFASLVESLSMVASTKSDADDEPLGEPSDGGAADPRIQHTRQRPIGKR